MRSPHPKLGLGLSVLQDAAPAHRAAPSPAPSLQPFAAPAAGQGRRASRRRPLDESRSVPSTGAASSLCWEEMRAFPACPYTPLVKCSPPPKPSELFFSTILCTSVDLAQVVFHLRELHSRHQLRCLWGLFGDFADLV